MKIRIFFRAIRESFFNIFRHLLLTFASVTTMTLMLLLLGSVVAFSLNLNQMAKRLGQQPQIVIYVTQDEHIGQFANAEQIANNVEINIQNFPGVMEYVKKTSRQNFEEFEKQLEEYGTAISDKDPDTLLPATFEVKLENPEAWGSFEKYMKGVVGVHQVEYSESIKGTLSKLRTGVEIGSGVVLFTLCLIAFFIIANTVRISIFSRRDEIEIMKYVGATNLYIRIPYVLEGIIIGLLGAGVSYLLLSLSYEKLYEMLMIETDPTEWAALIERKKLSLLLILSMFGFGSLVGAFGSFISVRKHVKV